MLVNNKQRKKGKKIAVDPNSRKARRKTERTQKKLNKNRPASDDGVMAKAAAPVEPPAVVVSKKKTGKRSRPDRDSGEDNREEDSQAAAAPKKRKDNKAIDPNDPYAHLSPSAAAAMRHEDEEIADLERKLGIGSKKQDKKKLNSEYARLEGYGDDFGDFLGGIDAMCKRVKQNEDYEMDPAAEDEYHAMMDADSSDDEDVVPMKAPAYDDDMLDEVYSDDEEDGAVDASADESEDSKASESEEEESEEDDREDRVARNSTDRDSQSDESEEEQDDSDADSEDGEEPDHDAALTYVPSQGQDIYGKSTDATESGAKPTKYVPPHLRNKQAGSQDDSDAARQESLRAIQRQLNSALNRLSEDTLIPVTNTIAKLYASHPTTDVNECLLGNTRSACVATSHLMTGLIPVYVAALAGVHIEKGDASQLGEYLLEKTVLSFQKQLADVRGRSEATSDDEDKETVDKQVCNQILILCYLHAYGIVHCSLIYDIVRDLIESFTEIDVELLLLVLSHCGRTLRSDDPSALKEIVLLVQKRAMDEMGSSSYSSRIEYMLSAMNDLKNNKRRKQDATYADKTAKLRKLLGRIKSNVASGKAGSRSSDSSLRISLDDIMNAEQTGRWWKVGASWAGNQNGYDEGLAGEKKGASKSKGGANTAGVSKDEEKLLKLAAKYRMNTDIRRSIFCIIMGSADCDDSFEKLVRGGMLKNKTERETARVLMECCGNEKSYNKFYSFLACRIIDYQPKSKFTFQLAFWDIFKQFDDLKVRKAANLAKLLFHLVIVHRSLKLNVLKAIDMSSPDEMPESAMIFLTIFLSSILEHCADPSEATQLFESGISSRKGSESMEGQEDALDHMDDGDALRASLTVFMMQVLKASPKYKKGSIFKANLKAAVKACDTENFF